MTDLSKLKISKALILKAEMMGLHVAGDRGGDIEAALREMVKLSAPFTHPSGNRRYFNYVFQVEDGRLVDVDTFNPRQRTRVPITRRDGTRVARVANPKRELFTDSVECLICRGTRMTKMGDVMVPCPKKQNPDLPICEAPDD